MEDNKGLPDYMLSFKSSERDDSESEELCPESVRRERYGDLQVSVSGTDLLVIKPEDIDENRYTGARININSAYNVSEFIDNLVDGKEYREAVRECYSSNSETPKRLKTFLEEDKLAEEYREPFRRIREDWLTDTDKKVRKEVGKDADYLLKEEEHNVSQVLDILASRYGMRPESIRRKYQISGNTFFR